MILIDPEYGPLRYILWCNGRICFQLYSNLPSPYYEGKQKYNVLVKHLRTEQGDIIIVDDSKIKNDCNHNQALTGMAIPVMKFSREGYKIRKGFGY